VKIIRTVDKFGTPRQIWESNCGFRNSVLI